MYNIIHDNFLELRKEQKEKNRKFSSREFHYIRLCTLYAVVVFPVSSSLSKFKWAFSTMVFCCKKAPLILSFCHTKDFLLLENVSIFLQAKRATAGGSVAIKAANMRVLKTKLNVVIVTH